MGPYEQVGRRVLERLERVDVGHAHLNELISNIKTHYRPNPIRTLATRIWSNISDPYQQAMQANPDSITMEEFIGRACVKEGNSLSAFEQYKNQNRAIPVYFNLLLGAMLEEAAPSNLFLGEREANACKSELRKAVAKKISREEAIRASLREPIKKIVENYTQKYNSRRQREEKFLGLAEQVAQALRLTEARRFGVTAHGEAFQANVGVAASRSAQESQRDEQWKILLPTIKEMLQMYPQGYFVAPEQWSRQDKRIFAETVYSKNLPSIGMAIIGDERANLRDELRAEDLESGSFKSVFVAPEELEKSLLEKALGRSQEHDTAGPASVSSVSPSPS